MAVKPHDVHVHGVAKVVTLVAAFVLFVTAVLSQVSIYAQWWSKFKPSSTDLVGGGKVQGDAEINLWTVKVTVLLPDPVDDSIQILSHISATWDNLCDTAASLPGGKVPSECPKIQACRAFSILTPLFALIADILIALAVKISPLMLLAGAAAALLCCLFGVTGLLLGIMTGTAGLGGPGYICLLISVMFAMLGFLSTLVAASKAMPHEDLIPHGDGTREDRVQAARDKEAAEARELDEHFQKTRKIKDPFASPRIGSASGRNPGESEPTSSDFGSKKVPVMLQKVIFWHQDNDVDDEAHIPTQMLELAFREIDRDSSGSIELEELVDSLRLCGLNASQAATDQILKEIDKNASGDVDIHEFVEFFRHIEELSRFQRKTHARAQFTTFVCNFCFLTHVVVVGVLLMLFIKMDEGEDPDNYMIMQNLLIVTSVALGILFFCVIALPAGRLQLGRHIDAWTKVYNATLKHRSGKKSTESSSQMGTSGGLRQSAWGGTLDGSTKPPPVNAALYGASYRVNKTMAEQTIAEMQMNEEEGYGMERSGIAPQRLSVTDGSHSRGPQGVILRSNGEMDRYDPGAYRVAAMIATETRLPTSFTPFQAKDDAEAGRRGEQDDPAGAPMALTFGSFSPDRSLYPR